MKISVFTPTHSPEVLDQAIESLSKQTFKDFEWVILLNGKAKDSSNKVINKMKGTGINYRIISVPKDTDKIGLLKKKACLASKGEFLVELDHDDYLREDCLEKVYDTFINEKSDFVYSDNFDMRDGKSTTPFTSQTGWRYGEYEGEPFTIAFEPSPLTFSYIWYSPNHVRCWRASFYKDIGGHDEDLDVCDDYELMCRTYIHGKCTKIYEPLYYYNLHENNTCYGEKNSKIQHLTRKFHDVYMESIVRKWCDTHGLLKIDLCSCGNTPDGFLGVDIKKFNDNDIVFDLNKPNWPFQDGSVGMFRSQDAVEHLKDPLNTIKEMHRCLCDYGWALIEVPSTDGRGAFQDPTHVSFWNSNSFWYYTKAQTAAYIGTPVKFQLNRIENYFPSKHHEEHNILYTKAHLVKLPWESDVIPAHGRDI